MKKHLWIFILLFAVLLFVPSTTLEAASDKAQVKKTVNTFFKAAKKYDTSKMKACFVNPNKTELFVTKKYTVKFIKQMNKKLKYEIKSVKVSGKTVTVKVWCKYQYAYYVYQKAFDKVVDYMIDHPNASNATVDKYVYQQISKYYKKMHKTKFSETITIKLKKTNGKWKIAKWTDDISNVVHASYKEAYDNYFEDVY
ncbi:MAG: hypothetical protein LUF92_08035 [Clostridiales bacterium]|nr:hypothetical protein [Clostridiales bacterium]